MANGPVRPERERHRRQICLGVATAGLLLRIVLHFTVLNAVVDDAYIFFRYARNAAGGHGLVYNVGHPVMGFTSPLYTVVLSVLAWLFGAAHLPGLSVVVGLMGYVASSVLLCRLAARHPGGTAAVVLWAAALPFVDGSLNGMETMLFATMLLLGVHELEQGRGATALLAAAGAALVRPEGILVAGAALAVIVRRGRPLPWTGAVAGALALGAWLGYAAVVYGSLVPLSISAKAGETAGLPAVGGPLGIAAQLAFGVSTSTFASIPASVRAGLEVVAMGGALLCAWDAVRTLRAGRGLAVFPLTYLLIALAYVVGHPVHIWTWYTVVPALCWAWSVTGVVAEQVARRRWPAGPEPALAALATAAAVATLLVGAPRRHQINTRGEHESVVAVSAAIARLRPPPQVIMLGDIGVVGWQNQARIIDLSGLVSPEPARRMSGTLPSLGRLIEQFKPDVLVLHSSQPVAGAVGEGSLSRQGFDSQDQAARFAREYLPVQVPGTGRVLFVRAAAA